MEFGLYTQIALRDAKNKKKTITVCQFELKRVNELKILLVSK